MGTETAGLSRESLAVPLGKEKRRLGETAFQALTAVQLNGALAAPVEGGWAAKGGVCGEVPPVSSLSLGHTLFQRRHWWRCQEPCVPSDPAKGSAGDSFLSQDSQDNLCAHSFSVLRKVLSK